MSWNPESIRSRPLTAATAARICSFAEAEALLASVAAELRDGDCRNLDEADKRARQAVRLGGNLLAWRAAEAFWESADQDRSIGWYRRACAAEFPATDAPDIAVDPEVMGPHRWREDYSLGCDFSVVVTEAPTELAAEALGRAAERLGLITEKGNEMSLEELELYGGSPGYWSIDYVSEVRTSARGPWLVGSTGDSLYPLLSRTALFIVIDELTRIGVTKARLQSAIPEQLQTS